MTGKKRIKIIPEDYLVAIAAVLLVGAHMTTQFVAFKQADLIADSERAEALVEMQEQNALIAGMIAGQKYAFVITFILLPALLLSAYITIRRKFKNTHPYVVTQIAIFFLLVAAFDVLNDLSVLAGLLAR